MWLNGCACVVWCFADDRFDEEHYRYRGLYDLRCNPTLEVDFCGVAQRGLKTRDFVQK